MRNGVSQTSKMYPTVFSISSQPTKLQNSKAVGPQGDGAALTSEFFWPSSQKTPFTKLTYGTSTWSNCKASCK